LFDFDFELHGRLLDTPHVIRPTQLLCLVS
jgi:hypothetical protein